MASKPLRTKKVRKEKEEKDELKPKVEKDSKPKVEKDSKPKVEKSKIEDKKLKEKEDDKSKNKEKAMDRLYKINIRDLKAEDLLTVVDAEIDQYTLVGHHIDSFNSFISKGIYQIVTQLFEIEKTIQNEREKTEEDQKIAFINFRAKFTDVRVNKPMISMHKSGKQNILMPNMARKNDMNYSSLVSMDATITAKAYLKAGGDPIIRTDEVKGFVVALPIMKGCSACHTVNLPYEAKKEAEEDPRDPGGEFIIRGGEWVISMIESRVFNSPHIFHNIGHEKEIARLEYISKPGDAYENSSELIMRYVTNGNIYLTFTSNVYLKVLNIPFYIIFRLLGMTTDKEVVDSIVYGYSTLDKVDVVSDHMLQIIKKAFRVPDNTFGDAMNITDLSLLLEYFSRQTAAASQAKNIVTGQAASQAAKDDNLIKYLNSNMLRILDKIVFPHVGLSSESRHKKARFLGYLMHKMFLVEMQIVASTDRDAQDQKRIRAAGPSYAKAFKTHFNLEVVQTIKKKLTKDFKNIPFSQVPLSQSFKNAIRAPDLEKALIQAIATGNKEVTVKNRQIPNRLASENLHRKNQLNVLSTLRSIRTPSTSASKQDQRADQMRRVHSSNMGYICILQSADTGESVGMIKQLAIGAKLSESSSSELLKETLLSDPDIIPYDGVFPQQIHEHNLVLIMVNGDPIGFAFNSPEIVRRYKEVRRGYQFDRTSGKFKFIGTPGIDPTCSIFWDPDSNEVNFWVDAGRLLRPVLIVRNNGELDSIGRELIGSSYNSILDPPVTLDGGGNPIIKEGSFIQDLVLRREDILALNKKVIGIKDLHGRGVIDYISPEEMKNLLIAPDLDNLKSNQTNPILQFTHCEIPACLLGLPALTCPYASHNQAPRITFQTNQSKQTCGWFSLSWPYRIDKHAFLQYYCEAPIIKTLANKYLYPNGMNEINCIACYSSFNQEDSLAVNITASERGIFKGSQLSFTKVVLEKKEQFANPDDFTMDINKHANYEHLVNGFVKKYTVIDKDDVIVGKRVELPKAIGQYRYKDTSVTYHYNEKATVDDVIRGKNQEGDDIVKIKYSSVRPYDVGSKFCLLPTAEILTHGGWKQITKITMGDKIATLTAEAKLEYHHSLNLYDYSYSGKMYYIDTPQVAITCTPNHKLYVRECGSDNDSSLFSLKEAQDVYGKRVQHMKNVKNYDMPDLAYYKISSPDGILPDKTVKMDDYLIFLGLWLASGHIDNMNTNRERIEILSLEKDKLKFINYIIEKLDLLATSGLNNKVIIHDEYLYNDLQNIDERFPNWIWNLNRRQALILLEALMPEKGLMGECNWTFYTLSQQRANDISQLVLHAGFCTHIQIKSNAGCFRPTRFQINILRNNKDDMPIVNADKQEDSYIDYSGDIFCLEVPNHIMYYRENITKPSIWISNSSRSGQKGMCSLAMNQVDMPFTTNGILPDKILSPFAIPSRMTIGHIIEGLTAKNAAIDGSFNDATIFTKTDIHAIGDELEKKGYDRYGVERMYAGINGEWIDRETFITPIYYQRLQKFVDDEVYSISTGPTCILTRQPLEGKVNNGGLRIGEMEKDVLLSHGASHFLMEKFRDDSDGFDVYICRTCKKTPIVNEQKNIIICNTCKAAGLDPDVVKVRSTWASKLFLQELESSNIGVLQTIKPYEYEIFDNNE